MPGPFNQDLELNLIVRLCRELAKLGFNVGMSDARPAAVIRPRVRAPLWVTVDDSHNYYEWLEAGKQYPTKDPEKAAALLADAIKAQGPGLGERP